MSENFYRIEDDCNRGMPLGEIPECNDDTLVWASITDSYRFFVKKSDEYEGFEGYLLSLVRGGAEALLWDKDCEVEVVLNVAAFFDGARHIYYHPADEGYGYCASTVVMACAFRMLSQFESALCSQYEEDDY